MEGQGVTNQRTEPHKSLISKNVSLSSNTFFSVKVYILYGTNKNNEFLLPDFKDKAEDAEGGLGVLQAEEVHRGTGKTKNRSRRVKTRVVFALKSS